MNMQNVKKWIKHRKEGYWAGVWDMFLYVFKTYCLIKIAVDHKTKNKNAIISNIATWMKQHAFDRSNTVNNTFFSFANE